MLSYATNSRASLLSTVKFIKIIKIKKEEIVYGMSFLNNPHSFGRFLPRYVLFFNCPYGNHIISGYFRIMAIPHKIGHRSS